MLNRLEEIPWGSLKHAYGFADDVPEQIKGLANSDSKIRENSLGSLYGNIFHQGTRYQATPYAIPFLFELIRNENVLEREKLIYFLINIALGYEEEYLPEGMNISKFQLEYEGMKENMTSEEREINQKYGYSPDAILDCYFKVEERVPMLQELINHKDKLVSRASIYALAWFPQKASSSIVKIIEKLPNLNEDIDIANAILSIGLLNTKERIKIQELEDLIISKSELIKVVTAISLAKENLQSEVLEVLIQGILSNNELQKVEGLYFNEGNISGYAGKILSKYGESKKEIIIPALCEILKSVNQYQSLDITDSIIKIINRNRKTPIIDTKLEDLEEIEIFALTSIANCGGWEGFGNYSLLMGDSGMPSSKKKLLEYLNKKT